MQKEFREILVFVAGATPQLITETLYGLAMQDPPVHPEELYIITTTTGKQRIMNTLVTRGILRQLVDEYKLPAIELKPDSFVLIKDEAGNELEDIRDEPENKATGDIISAFIQKLTLDPQTRLHCSLAGGRKTMSFYLGSALQLFGRPPDRLYHVLVTPEFESNPDFFYKPKKDREIECRTPEGRTAKLNTRDAVISLADLPFIRLGSRLSLKGKGFRELVAEGQGEIDTASIQLPLAVSLSGRTIQIGGSLIELVPVQMMIYMTFLRQKTLHCKYPERPYCTDCTDCFLLIADLSSRPALEEMAKDYSRIYRDQPLRAEELLDKWSEGMAVETLRQNLSKINSALKEQIEDKTLLPYYLVSNTRKYAGSRYGVRLEKAKIKIDG